MVLVEVLGFVLRVGELAFAAIVAGITGSYLNDVNADDSNDSAHARFIYTMVVAALSMLLAVIWLIPILHRILNWPVDVLISILWFVAFGLLVNFIGGNCGDVFNWQGIRLRGKASCDTWKADVAFSFLSAICWLASALIGVYLWHHDRKRDDRRHWYRHRSHV